MTQDQIEARLRALETQLATLTQMVADHMARLDELVTKHERTLFGTFPTNEESLGLETKVDRMWGSRKRATWFFKSLIPTMFAVLGTIAGAAAVYFLGLS